MNRQTAPTRKKLPLNVKKRVVGKKITKKAKRSISTTSATAPIVSVATQSPSESSSTAISTFDSSYTPSTTFIVPHAKAISQPTASIDPIFNLSRSFSTKRAFSPFHKSKSPIHQHHAGFATRIRHLGMKKHHQHALRLIQAAQFSTEAGFTAPVDPSQVGKAASSMDPDELEKLLKQFEGLQNTDPYEQARETTGKWQETPTMDGWLPGPDDPTLVMPTGPTREDTKPQLRNPVSSEMTKGPKKKLAFQTETRQMLDIVTNSLYTDKEVFLRELVSNGSDALEKARYLGTRRQLTDPEIPLEVRIFIDEQAKTITLQDTGIGMTHDELISHLGTIARSGSKQWVKDMKSQTSTDDIIGQFGVGFYSAFMVGSKLEVFSRTGKRTPSSGKSTEGEDPEESTFSADEMEKHNQGHYWVSDGAGEYEIAEADGVERGTKIVIHLRDDCAHFGTRQALDAILKKYSNFVGFPIYLNGLRVNTIQAIWNMSKNEVTEEQHAEFYRYLANAYDKPTYRMHFNADVPIQVNALFYFPERHTEKYGMGRMDPGTSLYSRKVLIKPKAKGLLPDYLRFVQGVVDSEDIPLNISRENMQDSLLISRISSVLTKRVIKHLQDEAKRNPTQYNTWYNEFGTFIREGICSDFTHKTELARLLRFDSSDSSVSPDNPASLDDYISRMPPDQTQIYYLNAPNRKSAMDSPYFEQIKASGYEVLFLYHPLDDFAMENLREFNRRKLCSAESKGVETSLLQQQKQLQLEQEYTELANYVKNILSDKVSTVTITDQVSKYPAYIVDHESSSVRKMMKMMDTQSMFGTESAPPVAKQKLHVNPKHPVMIKLAAIKDFEPTVAKAVLEQIFDNALVAADLLENPRDMLPRMQKILEMALDPTLVKQYETTTTPKQ